MDGPPHGRGNELYAANRRQSLVKRSVAPTGGINGRNVLASRGKPRGQIQKMPPHATTCRFRHQANAEPPRGGFRVNVHRGAVGKNAHAAASSTCHVSLAARCHVKW